MNKKNLHRHPISLPISLGIAGKIVREEKKKRRKAVPIQERGAKIRKVVHAAMAQLGVSPLRDAFGQ